MAKKTNRPTGVFKTGNEYQKIIDRGFFEGCPKTVFAAIAASYYLNQCGVGLEDTKGLTAALQREWGLLHDQGIVPQKPPAKKY